MSRFIVLACLSAAVVAGCGHTTYRETVVEKQPVVTRETIVNDDLYAIKQIPGKLAVSAAFTLAEFVYGFLTATSNIYDANPLFTQKTLWVRVGAAGSNSSLTTPVVGHMVLTTLRLSAFINDKFF